MHTVPITPFSVCENVSNHCLRYYCSSCFFGVANDCLNYYMREFAKGGLGSASFVRADLTETSRHWVWAI